MWTRYYGICLLVVLFFLFSEFLGWTRGFVLFKNPLCSFPKLFDSLVVHRRQYVSKQIISGAGSSTYCATVVMRQYGKG